MEMVEKGGTYATSNDDNDVIMLPQRFFAIGPLHPHQHPTMFGYLCSHALQSMKTYSCSGL